MKKIAKISLVAAIAVAGFTTANAQQLEDAIKKVEVTGSVVYRYNDYNNDVNDTTKVSTKTGGAENGKILATDGTTKAAGTESTSGNNYKAAMNLAAPVNDFVKLNTRFLVANDDGDFAGQLDSQGAGDSNVNVKLSNAYFGYTGIKNTTVNVGKQGLTTPWTVAIQADGNEQTGTGALALSTLGNVTLAGAYFNQTNLGTSGNLAGDNATTGSQDIATAGTIVAVGPVTLDAWYADMQGTFGTYTLGAKTATEIAGIKLGADARFTALQLDRNFAENAAGFGLKYDSITTTRNESNIHDDNSLAKLTLTASSGILSGKAAYGKTGKEGGLTALDNDASTTLLGWGVTANGKTDADYYQLVAAVDILPELNLSANYVNVDYTGAEKLYRNSNDVVIASDKTSVEEEEIYAQLTYKMSKNLTAYTRYGIYTKDSSVYTKDNKGINQNNIGHTRDDSRADSTDETRGRVQVAYTF